MTTTKYVIGSRGSRLALWQSEWVKARLTEAHPGVEFVLKTITTSGDAVLDRAIQDVGGKGIFTKEIEDALLSRSIDLAVHSLKDLPTELPPGLGIAAVTKREDVRDVFIPNPRSPHKTIDALPAGARVATGSLRRRAQLLAWRRDLQVVDIRGNVPTRFEKLDASDWAGMILARAGVVRLGFAARIGEVIDADRMVPAVGQGALGVEVREGEPDLEALLAPIVSEATTFSTTAERAFLGRLEGGCHVPIGAWGRIENGELHLDGLVASVDGTLVYRGKASGDPAQAASIGRSLAETLLAGGAAKALETVRGVA